MKVWPRSEGIRRVLRHANGVGFQDEGPADWPDDPFTRRTMLDGDVTAEDPGAAEGQRKAEAEAGTGAGAAERHGEAEAAPEATTEATPSRKSKKE